MKALILLLLLSVASRGAEILDPLAVPEEPNEPPSLRWDDPLDRVELLRKDLKRIHQDQILHAEELVKARAALEQLPASSPERKALEVVAAEAQALLLSLAFQNQARLVDLHKTLASPLYGTLRAIRTDFRRPQRPIWEAFGCWVPSSPT